MRPGRYLALLAATALAAAAALRLANVWAMAPATVDRTHFVLEQKVVRQLLAQQPVVVIGRLHEWMLRWHHARLLPAAPAAVVLGSSHSLGVSGEIAGTPGLVNFSISGSSLADHLVTSGILESRGFRPGRWIVFVDAWLFDPAADARAWRWRTGDLLAEEARLAAAASPALPRVFSADLARNPRLRPNPFTLEPLLQSLDGLVREHTVRAYTPADGVTGRQLLAVDGSLNVNPDEDDMTLAATSARALRQFRDLPDRHRYGTYERIDEDLWRYFEQWVAVRRSEGAEVWLVFSPYHPSIYPRLIQLPSNQLRPVEARTRALAARLGATVLGSYDPAALGLGPEHFFDGDHLLDSGLRRLLAPARPPG